MAGRFGCRLERRLGADLVASGESSSEGVDDDDVRDEMVEKNEATEPLDEKRCDRLRAEPRGEDRRDELGEDESDEGTTLAEGDGRSRDC